MALQLSTGVRDAQANAIETTVGASPVLRLYSGTPPANCAAALSGNTLLATGSLPSDWLTAASGSGNVTKNGTWTVTGQSGASTGTAATFFRIWESTVTTAHIQGTVTATGGGGDMTLNNNSIADTQTVTVSTFSYTRANS